MKGQRSSRKIHHASKRRLEKNAAPYCPYCGRRSVLRPAEYVYGENTIDAAARLYVCSGYPGCNAYVGVHDGTTKPMGSLANPELRNKRIRAHRAINRIIDKGYMSKDDIYAVLALRLNVPRQETHIGQFSDYLCEQAILECERMLGDCDRISEEKAA